MITTDIAAKTDTIDPATHKASRGASGLIAVLICLLVIASFFDAGLMQVVISTIADAYLQVSAFVAGTLLLFFSAEKLLKIDISAWMQRAGALQVPTAALLGALPGCGGAIIVVTRYVTGNLSFGSVLATLTATMGDAAFLVLATEPQTGVLIMVLGFSVGTISGWIVDATHGRDFLRSKPSTAQHLSSADIMNQDFSSRALDKLWMVFLVPGIIIGILQAFQYDVDSLLAGSLIGQLIEQPATILGFLGGSLCLVMWFLPRVMPTLLPNRKIVVENVSHVLASGSIIRRAIADTNFVTGWVIIAFLVFEVSLFVTGYELSELFQGLTIWLPLMAVAIGLLPGCGPQVLVTTLYLAGIVPLSAQIGNAISNDGDALFPAIALAPKAALVATLYSTIPALILAYGWYFYQA